MIYGVDVDHTIAMSEPYINKAILDVQPKAVLNVKEYHKGVSEDIIWSALRLMVKRGDFLKLEPIPKSVEMMKTLEERGHIVYYITNRYKCYDGDMEAAKKELKQWLEENGFPFAENAYPIDCSKENKGDVCKRLGIDILIDDIEKNLDAADQQGVKGMIYTAPWNQACVKYDRIESW
jgi:5'(3')-deoxyribonucleotidase